MCTRTECAPATRAHLGLCRPAPAPGLRKQRLRQLYASPGFVSGLPTANRQEPSAGDPQPMDLDHHHGTQRGAAANGVGERSTGSTQGGGGGGSGGLLVWADLTRPALDMGRLAAAVRGVDLEVPGIDHMVSSSWWLPVTVCGAPWGIWLTTLWGQVGVCWLFGFGGCCYRSELSGERCKMGSSDLQTPPLLTRWALQHTAQGAVLLGRYLMPTRNETALRFPSLCPALSRRSAVLAPRCPCLAAQDVPFIPLCTHNAYVTCPAVPTSPLGGRQHHRLRPLEGLVASHLGQSLALDLTTAMPAMLPPPPQTARRQRRRLRPLGRLAARWRAAALRGSAQRRPAAGGRQPHERIPALGHGVAVQVG